MIPTAEEVRSISVENAPPLIDELAEITKQINEAALKGEFSIETGIDLSRETFNALESNGFKVQYCWECVYPCFDISWQPINTPKPNQDMTKATIILNGKEFIIENNTHVSIKENGEVNLEFKDFEKEEDEYKWNWAKIGVLTDVILIGLLAWSICSC